jgi:Flp pilus assembly pilin Flp
MMKKLLKRLLIKEEGQGFAEYAVLFPGAIMVVIAMIFSLGPGLKDRYCEIVGMFSNGICAVADADIEPEDEPDLTPTPTEEYCVVLQQEQGCSQCDAASPDCICLPGTNEGTYEADDLKSLVIKAGKEYHVFYSGWTDDGCYYVQLEDTYAWWQKYEDGSDCQDVSHIQAWWLLICSD